MIPPERKAQTEKYIRLAPCDSVHHQFVAIADKAGGKELVAATATLLCGARRTRHVGEIAVMVHADYQGCWTGNARVAALLDASDNWLMLVRMELSVLTMPGRCISIKNSVFKKR
ncbi:MAG: hypothetical protein RR998_04650 [Oscillospiraceae bacterium]